MLGKIDLNHSISKKQYKGEMKALSERLTVAVQKAKGMGIPVLIVFEGWSAAGKGTLIKNILYPLDPRDFYVRTMGKVNEEILMRPYLWRYWTQIPPKGKLAIFERSWHRLLFNERRKLTRKERDNFYEDVLSFERQLNDDGTVIVKFFLHIDKDEQTERFEALRSKAGSKWRVDKTDLNENKGYEKRLRQFEAMLQNTHSGFAPWHILEANDSAFATIKAFKILISTLEAEINRRESAAGTPVNRQADEPIVKILRGADTSKTVDKDVYRRKLEKLQSRMSELGYELYSKRMSVVIVYEGWDAAGKGGNIKRVTERLDPRGYIVEPIAAPSTDEKSRHYLWRFWNRMPKDGHITIFDRSWYGRLMVERVEGFCSPEEHRRAYSEINAMERQIVNHGTPIIKFWLHIDKDEQLRRFTERQNNPLKQYKITDEDWRNREKWEQYEDAVDEMLFRTSTREAPWHIIESNDKRYARIKALEIAVDAIERALKEKDRGNP